MLVAARRPKGAPLAPLRRAAAGPSGSCRSRIRWSSRERRCRWCAKGRRSLAADGGVARLSRALADKRLGACLGTRRPLGPGLSYRSEPRHSNPSPPRPYPPRNACWYCVAACVLLRTPIFLKMRCTWFLTVYGLISRQAAISMLVFPQESAARISLSRRLSSPPLSGACDEGAALSSGKGATFRNAASICATSELISDSQRSLVGSALEKPELSAM